MQTFLYYIFPNRAIISRSFQIFVVNFHSCVLDFGVSRNPLPRTDTADSASDDIFHAELGRGLDTTRVYNIYGARRIKVWKQFPASIFILGRVEARPHNLCRDCLLSGFSALNACDRQQRQLTIPLFQLKPHSTSCTALTDGTNAHSEVPYIFPFLCTVSTNSKAHWTDASNTTMAEAITMILF